MPKKGDRTGYTISCEYCGKMFYVTKTRYNRSVHHFCCRSCSHKFVHDEVYEDRPCGVCGKMMHIRKNSTQRFCSIDCQKEWQKTRTGVNNPKFTSVLVACDWCKKDFYTAPYKIYSQEHHFCSKKCRQDWYANIWSQQDTWKEAARKRALDLMHDNPNLKNTHPQQIINQLLDDMHIAYINEYNCNYYAMDNYLSEFGLMIEVMGDFWHSNPLKYPVDGLRDIQKRRISKDMAKHTYIKNTYDVDILYLWEQDILNRLDVCKLLIQEYIENKGVLLNYHSFNYYVESEKLILKREIILSYFDKITQNQSVVNA